MKYTYEVIESETPNGISKVIKRNDGVFIPFDESNADYQRYLNPDLENDTIS